VEKLTFRLLPYAVADGPTNMATDEVLLSAALAGVATLRWYGWSAPTLSLGYFQRENIRHADPLLAGLPCVRRPSGGDALVHHHEVTYALGLPASWLAGTSWVVRMHEIIAAALATFGVAAHLFEPVGPQSFIGPLCFPHFTAGDVMVGAFKVAGSAQRKHRGVVLQHGGILLGRSPHTPALPGIKELTGQEINAGGVCAAATAQFAAATGARLLPGTLTEEEKIHIAQLVVDKYASPKWTGKR
jgi:lipoyl(octanoyl) transferase